MSEITRAVIGMPFEMAMENDLSRKQFHSRAQALLAENETLRGLYQMHKQTETREMRDLKAELAGLKTGYEAYERVNAELRAENEALRSKFENPDPILIQCMDSAIAEQEQLEKDAKRYRWLRNSAGSADWEFFGHQGKEATDHNIDAAMSKEASHD